MSNQAMTHRYLLEIGTEELPVEFLKSAPTELADKLKVALDGQGIAYGAVTVYAAPRRLALVVDGLPQEQEARTFKTKGPPVRVALGADGKPTQAGLGFARKMGVEFSELKQEAIEGETYMVLEQAQPGRPVRDLLAELLPDLVLGLSGSHFMAWGDYTIRFSRPIRWLLSLWNETHLPLAIGPVNSGTVSYGHRVLSDGPIRVASADAYLATLEREGAVLADPDKRREIIWRQLQQAAVQAGGQVSQQGDLLDTVTMLVEHPSVVVGQFQERFLEIPEEVTTTVMMAHQKYFPVRDDQGRLMPCFMTVSNGRKEAAEIIRHGNEKVLTARLEDARFFFAEDQKVSLEARLEELKGITFQKGLGSMYEKAHRLVKLAGEVADALGYDESAKQHTQRAALLAKADLVTGMVFEFTELQGVMGSKYARIGGEPEEVARAIDEHYLPRFAGDELPQTQAGIAVNLADKIDTMVAVFSQKNAKLPSGSKDPLGLRRMASGVIQILLENPGLRLDLTALVRSAYQSVVESVPVKADSKKGPSFQDGQTTLDLVGAFILQRLRGILLEQDNRYDIIDAVLESGDPLADLGDVTVRIGQLKKLTLDEAALKRIYEPGNRIARILGDKYNPQATVADVSPDLLKDPAEQALLDAAAGLELENPGRDYDRLVSLLAGLDEPVERFFEKVMVNDPDEAVRKNRYNLLSVLNRFYMQLACFPKLVV